MKPKQFSLQLQNCNDEDINIQCFNEINEDVAKLSNKKKYHDILQSFDQQAKDIWGNSYLQMMSDYKPDRTGIVMFGLVSRRIKQTGYNKKGR